MDNAIPTGDMEAEIDSLNAEPSTALVVGASRGLGLAIAAALVVRRWRVIATVRTVENTALRALAQAHPGRLKIETLDVDASDQIAALAERLAARRLDMLFVNAGTTTRDENVRIGTVATDEFLRVMATNALGPMRVIDALAPLVPEGGVIGAMSSGQGSITNNDNGLREVYRASKAALNMLMRSFANRQGGARAIVLMAPGWVRTELGGEQAPYSIEETVPLVVDVLLAQRGRPGLRYLDRFGKTIPW